MKKWLSLLLALLLCAACLPAMAQAQFDEGAQLYDFAVMLDGALITFPTTVQTFEDLGWTYAGKTQDEMLDPYYYTVAEQFKKGQKEIYLIFYNGGYDTLPLLECAVSGISMDEYQAAKGDGTSITLPGGIVYGESTQADAEAVYGTPSDIYEGSMYNKCTYQLDSYNKVELYFSSETGLLNQVALRNFVLEETPANDISQEAPACVADYEAPTEISDDLFAFEVEFAGALYSLPAPLSAFEQNGWQVSESDRMTVVRAHDTLRVEIRYDNQTFRTSLYNDSDTANYAYNCMVTSVVSEKLPITIARGVILGMEDTVLDTFSDIEVEVYEGSSYISYTLKLSSRQCIDIYVSTETNQIYKIEVENRP